MKRGNSWVFTVLGVFLVVPSALQAEILFGAGIGDEGGVEVLYRLDTDAGNADPVCVFDSKAPDNPNSPNGLAFDATNQRLYFSINQQTGDGSSSELWFCDLNTGQTFAAGTLAGQAAGATFDQAAGRYLYILNGSDDLSAVSLNPDGTIATNGEFLLAPDFSGADDIVFRGGDLAMDCDGLIYGSSLGSGGGSKVFFSIDTAAGYSYSPIVQKPSGNNTDPVSATAKQLSFGQDGTLFAQSGGIYWSVNPATGALGNAFDIPSGAPISMSDLASGLDCSVPVCFESETAWADGERYTKRGNWATYTPFSDGSIVDIFAGRDIPAGQVTLEAMPGNSVKITIELQNGFVFSQAEESGAAVGENLHVQGYPTAPWGNPAPGQFEYKSLESGVEAEIIVDAASYYGIHLVVDDTTRPRECPIETVCVDFTVVPEGGSVEGPDTVIDGLDISTPTGGAISLRGPASAGRYAMYGAANNFCYADPVSVWNGGMDEIAGGFGDVLAKIGLAAHAYTFTFDASVKNFYLRMLDYGDYNPRGRSEFAVEMTAFSATNTPVDHQMLQFKTEGPTVSDLGNLICGTGDAVDADPLNGDPGNFYWAVGDSDVKKVSLVFDVDGLKAYDPNIAFDTLCVDRYVAP